VRIVGIIPSRWASTRLPGKPLADLDGRPLIEHVWRRARRVRAFSRLLVATDDARILNTVRAFGGEAVMTPAACASGTDRLAWVARRIPCDVVVNIQGDEPFVPPAYLEKLIAPFRRDPGLSMTTLAAPLPASDRQDPGRVKVVCSQEGYALYFSRAPIPFIRDGRVTARSPFWLHLGLYGYQRDFLLRFARWAPTPLENLEQLEQLRALEHGVRIQVGRVTRPTLSIDTPKDLQRARALLARSKE
jgi:3-deoxy-manno-octulosonate cytidylyltransferase (CMP-KDO synthetase)